MDSEVALPPLPAGIYELEAWHERCEARTATVRVAAGGRAEANFEFALTEE